MGYNFSVAVWVGYIALFGIAVETGVVMVVYLHESLDKRLASGVPLKHEDRQCVYYRRKWGTRNLGNQQFFRRVGFARFASQHARLWPYNYPLLVRLFYLEGTV